MKLLAFRMIITVAASLFLVFQVHAGGEVQKVCHAEKDKKGKEVQVCKQVKIHKKLDGTKIPTK